MSPTRTAAVTRRVGEHCSNVFYQSFAGSVHARFASLVGRRELCLVLIARVMAAFCEALGVLYVTVSARVNALNKSLQ